MNEFQFPGAQWWKFDFHTHTPESIDFSDKTMSPELWLKAFMDKEIDCVAITDHNSGDWIDILQEELKKLQANRPHWYRPLYLFPGVEISANGGVHILAIFGCDHNRNTIDNLLDAVKFHGTKGDSDAVTTKSITEVINEIVEREGIPIPAHVDKTRGLFVEITRTTLQQILDNENINAMELCDSNYQKPPAYTIGKIQWTEIRGSDTHNFNADNFGTFTWVKMDEPSIEGLKLALQDGDVSVNRNMNANPNQLPKYFIESLKISNAQYIGRPKPLNCQFSPFLNAIIGGRGKGKSTLLEFMRLVLRRDKDLPKMLQNESRKYFNVDDDGSLLIEDSKLSLIYQKDNIRYRLNWSPNPDYPSLEEEKNGTWEPCDRDIKLLLPVYIYSQKQIFELARNTRALIDIVDKAPEVDANNIKTKIRESVNKYKHIEGEQRELNEIITQKNQLGWELSDLARQIDKIEKSGHKEVMQNYRERQQQLNEFENIESKWKEMHDQLLETRNAIVPEGFNAQHFSKHTDISSAIGAINKKWQSIYNQLSELVQQANSSIAEWQTEKNAADWMQVLKDDMTEYEQLHSELKQQGIAPDKYPLLLTQHKEKQKELDMINEYQAQRQVLEAKKEEVFKEIKENRKKLTENRQKFLASILKGNQFVSIEVQPFSEGWEDIESELRRILHCQDRFDRDINHLKEIYNETNDRKIEKIKETVKSIRNGNIEAKDKRFATHIKSLTLESMIDLTLWFPEDFLKITYGTDHKPIERTSPGERASALLAFILSYGDEPLLLDQPEDDLDNELISDLIVKQLRNTKTKRQIIVVTHNANIVVNGDAEMVLPLEVVKGQTYVQQPASIQEKNVRESICKILEGGERAFEQRYKRIHLGD